jgi:L,D-peptidoglycan transpeptidase YkuD (ErfK/YbiS/YcfS/YnhG family)
MAGLYLYIVFIQLLMSGVNNGFTSEPHDRRVQTALNIVSANSQLIGPVRQILVVFDQEGENQKVSLVAVEKRGKSWRVAHAPVEAGIGRNGFAAPDEKREGDNKSPSGFFRLGKLFSYDSTLETHMPFIQTTIDDKWIDDPESPDYNRYVRGETTAASYEKLLINTDEYRRCLVIEYNTDPVIKGMGSAIFLHLSLGAEPNSSSGCVVVTPPVMDWLLKWLNPSKKPSILMGPKNILQKGLK